MIVPVPACDDSSTHRRTFVGWAAGLAVGVPHAAYLGRGRVTDAVAEASARTGRLRRLDDHMGGADTYPIYLAEMDGPATAARRGDTTEAARRGLLSGLAKQGLNAGFSSFDAGWQPESSRLF